MPVKDWGDVMINVDQELTNADWTKQTWDLLPPYKSEEFMEMLEEMRMELEHFKTLPVYEHAVDKGLIKDDEWVEKEPDGG